VLLTILTIVVGSVLTYNGQCGSIIMEPTHEPCNLLQYIGTQLFIFSLVGVFIFWWAILLILLLPPLVGYAVGWRLDKRS
jgi:hypothetical protein